MKRLAGITLLLSLALSTFAQRFGFQVYGVKQGLTHSQIRSVAQDSLGYIWIGTLGGLSRFDGREFTTFGKEDGFPYDQVECVSVLDQHRIAAGSTGAFAIIEDNTCTLFELGPEKAQSAIRDMRMAADGTLWLATQSGVFTLDPSGKLSEFRADVFGESDVRMVIPESDGIITLTSAALVRWTKNVPDTIYHDPQQQLTDAIQLDPLNWALSSNGEGVIIGANNEWKSVNPGQGLVSLRILDLSLGQKGSIWASSRLGFSELLGTQTIQSIGTRNGLPYPEVRTILQDREGNVWLGTDGGGLIKYLGRAFSLYTREDGLPSNLIMGMAEGKDGKLCIATYDEGIAFMQEDGSIVQGPRGLINDKVWTVINDRFGRYWVATSGGISVVDKDKITDITREQGLSSNKVLCLREMPDGTVWAGTSSGVSIIAADLREIRPLKELPATKVRAILPVDKAFWFACSDGVYVLSGGSVRNIGLTLPELQTSCSSIVKDKFGRIWIGSKSGLYCYDNGKLIQVDLGEDNTSNFINFLLPREEGMLAGTNNGIFLVQKNPGQLPGVLNYGLDDGLGSLETNMNAVLELQNGTVWFGTTAGLMRRDRPFGTGPGEPLPPLVHLTEARLNLTRTDWSKLGITTDLGLPVNLDLPYNRNHLTFYFNGISTTYPEDLQYQYILEGFDEDWQPLTKVNFATYANLPDGAFTFRVKALSKEGIWSENRGLDFVIHPPFWTTWWFLGLSALVLVALIYLFLRRRRRIMMMEVEKERLEMRSKMLSLEQQSLNSSMNRHFIFNALNSIQYYINRKDRISANKYLSSFARLIRKNLDSSQVTTTSLSEELERLKLYLELEQMRFPDKFEYHIRISEELDPDEVRVPSMLLQPFLENSIWHGILPKDEKGNVELEIGSNGKGQVIFTITDDGIGVQTSRSRKPEDQNHISKGMSISGGRLELFQRMTGKHVGMEGPKEILNHDGTVKGTSVTIHLPLEWPENWN